MIKKICKILITFLTILSFNVIFTFAESKEVDLISLDEEKDIVVTFTFDKEIVNVDFIKPDGTIEDDVKKEENEEEKWCIYSIDEADAGDWKIRYDKGENENIEYSIVEQERSIVVDSFNHTFNRNEITASFKILDKENQNINYEIIAVDNNETSSGEQKLYKLKDGVVSSNVDVNVNIGLFELPSGTYRLKLNVHRENDDFEVFDTEEDTEILVYENTWEPKEISDFDLYVDKTKGTIIVDYENYKIRNAKKYRVTLYEDEKESYVNEVNGDVNEVDYLYNKDSKKLKIGVSYITDKLWSKIKLKEVKLDEEYLDIENLDEKGSSYLNFIYKVATNSNLHIEINNKVNDYPISGSGTIVSYLDMGQNSISAILPVSNNIFYQVDQKKTYVLAMPTIKLYENLDGKIVYTDKIKLVGAVRNSEKFTINGKEVKVTDNEFNVQYVLPVGKNTFELVAENSEGSIERIEFTVDRKYSLEDLINDFKNNILNYKILLATLGIGLILIILVIVFAKKRKDKNKIGILFVLLLIASILADAFAISKYFERINYTNDIGFINMTEKSLLNASKYLEITDNLLKVIYIISGFVFLMIVLLVIKIIRNAKSKKNDKTV